MMDPEFARVVLAAGLNFSRQVEIVFLILQSAKFSNFIKMILLLRCADDDDGIHLFKIALNM